MHNRAFVTRLFGLLLIGIGLSGSSWSLAQETAKAGAAAAEAAPTPALIRQGQELFLGVTRFSAGGPSCNACHNVINDAVIGGGTLAMDLTESFGRLGAEGTGEDERKKETGESALVHGLRRMPQRMPIVGR